MVIEIVGSHSKIEEFLDAADGMVGSGLVTLEKVQVLCYRNGQSGARGSSRALRRARQGGRAFITPYLPPAPLSPAP
jgi:hypothetical protein